MENSVGVVMIGLIVIYTVLALFIYHKSCEVVYFNFFKGIIKELFVALFVATIMTVLTLYFWVVAVIIIAILGLGLMAKADDPAKKIFVIIATIVVCILIGKAGITLKESKEEKATVSEQGKNDSDDEFSYNRNDNDEITYDNDLANDNSYNNDLYVDDSYSDDLYTDESYADEDINNNSNEILDENDYADTREFISFENYFNENMTTAEMCEALQATSLDFYLDENGDCWNSDGSVYIRDTEMGGSQIAIMESYDMIYSFYDVCCGMSGEDAVTTLSNHGSIETTYADDGTAIRCYFDGKYTVFLGLEDSTVVTIIFCYYLE